MMGLYRPEPEYSFWDKTKDVLTLIAGMGVIYAIWAVAYAFGG
jgi:hypothetical protein